MASCFAADAAASAVHEHGLPGGQVGHAVQRDQRRQIVHRYRRGRGIVQSRRHAEGERRRHDDAIGVAAKPRQRQHAVADAMRRNPRTDLVDETAYLVADHDRRLRRVGIQPEAGEDVGKVDPRRADRDAQFALARHRIGRLAQREYLRRTMAKDHDLPHGTLTVSEREAYKRVIFRGLPIKEYVCATSVLD